MEKDLKSGGRGDGSESTKSHSKSTIKRKGDFDAITKTFRSIKEFYMRIWRGDNLNSRYGRDLYSWMLACDLICFVLMMVPVLGNMPDQQFVPVNMQVSKNVFRVDYAFILILVISMLSMTLDRILHVKKSIKGKLILMLVQHIVIHPWIFIFMPIMTDNKLVSEKPLVQVWYAFRSVYFILSSWQVSNGYPRYIRKKRQRYGLWEYAWFMCYLFTPFIMEFRVMTNWISTDTALNFSEYLRFETMYCTLYDARCKRQLEKNFPKAPSEATNLYIKVVLAMALLIFCTFIALIGFILFALINLIGVHYRITMAQLDIYIQGYPPLFTTSITDRGRLANMTTDQWRYFVDKLGQDPVTEKFEASVKNFYKPTDIQLLNFTVTPSYAWDLPIVAVDMLLRDLKTVNKTMQWCAILTLTRDQTQGEKMHSQTWCKPMQDLRKEQLLFVIGHLPWHTAKTKTKQTVSKPQIPKGVVCNRHWKLDQTHAECQLFVDINLPLVIKMPLDGKAQDFIPKKRMKYRMGLAMEKSEKSKHSMDRLFWKFYEEKYLYAAAKEKKNKDDEEEAIGDYGSYTLICLVDLFFPPIIQAVAGSGTMYVIYTMVVLPIGLKLRQIFLRLPAEIIWEEPQFVDRLLRICEDIELVQKSGKEYAVEESLYAKLLCAFLNPEIFIHATKFPRIRNPDALKPF